MCEPRRAFAWAFVSGASSSTSSLSANREAGRRLKKGLEEVAEEGARHVMRVIARSQKSTLTFGFELRLCFLTCKHMYKYS